MNDADYGLKIIISTKNALGVVAAASLMAAVITTFMFAIMIAPEADVVDFIGDIIGFAISMLIAYVGLSVIIMTAKKQAEKEEDSDT